MIAGFQAGDARPDLHHHARTFVAEDGGEQALGVQPIEGVGVGVADPGGLDLDQHLAGAGAFEIDLDDFEGTFRLEGDGGAGFHGWVQPLISVSGRSSPRACSSCQRPFSSS